VGETEKTCCGGSGRCIIEAVVKRVSNVVSAPGGREQEPGGG